MNHVERWSYQHLQQENHPEYYPFNDTTALSPTGNSTGGPTGGGELNNSRASAIMAISLVLFAFAVLPVVLTLKEKYTIEPESLASDGDTVAEEEDLKDIETASIPPDISVRSVAPSDTSLHDGSRKGHRNRIFQ